jgi:DNA-binding response OmpR family regulator
MYRLIVVEDEAMVARLLARLLSRWGFEVDVAEDCVAARRALSRRRFDVALIDGLLPDGRGWDLAAELADAHPRMVVLGMSGTACPQEFLDAGAHRFFRKPLEMGELRRCLEDVCDAAPAPLPSRSQGRSP